jgi:hypothetical protein
MSALTWWASPSLSFSGFGFSKPASSTTEIKLSAPNDPNNQLVSPFLIVYNVAGAETDGFHTHDIARIKEIPKKLLG